MSNTLKSSPSILTQFLEDDDLITCLKDSNKKVLHQDENCIKLCGDYIGRPCHKGCMKLYENDTTQQWSNWGSRNYKNQFLHNSQFDVTIISSTDYILTILQTMQQKYRQALRYYEKFDLGKRELEVIELAISGLSNPEIADKLSISVTTLRTHLKNIYSKVKDSGGSLEFLPFERSQHSN